MKSVLKYPGSKWRIADWIVSNMPPHDIYVEPFFGSGAVFFSKPESRLEVLNDIDGNVVNFFKVCRDHPDDLARLLALTPYAREEYDFVKEPAAREPLNLTGDNLEDARRFAVRCWQGTGTCLGQRTGWKHDVASKVSNSAHHWCRLPERVAPVRLFIDMDGTLAVFTPVDRLETLYEPEYFETLPPIVSVCKAVKLVAASGQAELYILSSVLPGSPYAVREKSAWLDRYLPQINPQHRLFPPCGQSKAFAVPGGLQPGDTLLDDYTDNLLDWPGRGIKLYNGINGNRGRWQGDCLRYDKTPEQIAQALLAITRGEARVFDARPGSGHKDRVELIQSPTIEY